MLPPRKELIELGLTAVVVVDLTHHSIQSCIIDVLAHAVQHLPQLLLVQSAAVISVKLVPQLAELDLLLCLCSRLVGSFSLHLQLRLGLSV